MPRAGIKGQAYMNTGTYDTPEWVRMRFLRDQTIDVAATQIAIRNKSSRFVKYLMGLEDVPIDCEYDWTPDDPVFKAMHEAHYKRSFLDIVFLDGKISDIDATGFRGDFLVTNWGDQQPVDDAETLSLSLRLAAESPNEPGPVKVASSGLVRIFVDEEGNEIAANRNTSPDDMIADKSKKTNKSNSTDTTTVTA